MIDNAQYRFGKAEFAKAEHLRAAGLFDKTDLSIFVGFFDGRPVYFHGPAGMVVTAGARAGKMRDFLAHNILTGNCLNSLIMLDLKGEGAAISQDQTADRKFCGYWNPAALHNLPQDRINVVDYLALFSMTLVSDMKTLWENLIATSGSAQADYFEGRAREYGEAIGLTLVEMMGVLTLPDLFRAVNLIPAGGEEWLDFAYHMANSQFEIARRVEAEIALARKSDNGGFRGILGELLKSLACLSDPILNASVSPPYTMSLADLVSGEQAWQLYLMPPAEFVGAWAPVIKSFFTGAMIYKSRAPSARRITFFLDECGQLAGGAAGGFPLVPKLFTYGAGIGVQPVAVFQTNRQMKNLGPNAESLIMSSAAAKLMFALRDIESASDVSRMLGNQTLEYDDRMAQERAAHARDQAIHSVLNGGDILQAGFNIAHHGFEAQHRSKQHRSLQLPEEVMNMPSNRAYYFNEDVPHPILLERRPYWDQVGLTFHPNPYHPPLDRVRVQTRWGKRTRKIVTKPVEPEFVHYPQYRDGMRSRVEK